MLNFGEAIGDDMHLIAFLLQVIQYFKYIGVKLFLKGHQLEVVVVHDHRVNNRDVEKIQRVLKTLANQLGFSDFLLAVCCPEFGVYGFVISKKAVKIRKKPSTASVAPIKSGNSAGDTYQTFWTPA